MITLGIVILNYKTFKDTERLTNHLLQFNMSSKMHIVIVDNFSQNDSFSYLTSKFKDVPQVSVLQSGSNGGYAKGNNIGLKFLEKYKPEYALILNNDIYFNENVIESCINYYKILSNPGAISPVQYLPDGKIAPLVKLQCNSFFRDLLQYSLIYNILKKPHQYKSNTPWLTVQKTEIIPGCFIFISYEKFKSIGFFYEGTFLFCEERFLYRKLNQFNYINYTLLDLHYVHDHSLTIRSEVSKLKQIQLMNDGHILYTKEYRRFPNIKCKLLKWALKWKLFEIKLLNKIRIR